MDIAGNRNIKMCEYNRKSERSKHSSNMFSKKCARTGTTSIAASNGSGHNFRLRKYSPSLVSSETLHSFVSRVPRLSYKASRLLLLSSSSPSSLPSLNLRLLSSLLLLLLLAAVGCEALPASQESEIQTEAVDKYLSSFGYYSRSTNRHIQADHISDSIGTVNVASDRHTESERHKAIKQLQKFFRLPVSGELDDGTRKILRTARCGREDIDQDNDDDNDDDGENDVRSAEGRAVGNRRMKRYSVSRYGDGTIAKWTFPEMRWRITLPSSQLPESKQREVIREALAVWARYVPIKFVEDRSQNEPDINIRWERREHGPAGDPVFDGKIDGINVLAHAWGPGFSTKGLAGDVHIDEDDNWTDYNTLLGVVVHELGHVMGLGHSKDETAIMYPAYRSVIELGQDDVDGINLIYGSGLGVRPGNPDGNRGETRYTNERPDPRYQTQRPDPRYQTQRPDPRYQTVRPDPRYQTERPDPRYRTQRPDPRYQTERPDPRYWTQRPGPRYWTERPDPRYRTQRPDPRYRTQRPDPRYWTEQPDPRIVPLNPWTRGPYNTVRPEWIDPEVTTTTIDMCMTLNIDAVFEDPTVRIGRVYFAVSNENVHTLKHGILMDSQPLKSVYPEVPQNPDVAFSLYSKGAVYFIKDNTMWAYRSGQLQPGYPRSLSDLKFPERPRFAVSLSQRDDSSELLLFGEQYWWRFNVDRSTAITPWPISEFSGELPKGVKFAAQWIDNNLYAVTQDSYVIMDLNNRRITHEAPIPGKPEWLQALCGHASRATLSVTSLVFFAFLASALKSIML